MPADAKPQVEELKRLLEAELERSLPRQWGCWPLFVGIVGLLVGIALLIKLL